MSKVAADDDDERSGKERLNADIAAKEAEIAEVRAQITQLQRKREALTAERVAMVKARRYLD